MRPPPSALLVLALVFGGCAAPDESLPTAPLEAPTTYGASSSTSTVAVATVTSSSSTSTTTTVPPVTASIVPVSPIVLRGDGLGVVSFGDPVEDVMAILTGWLGTPSSDEFPYPGESIFPGSYWRVVIWDTPKLTVSFIDWLGSEILDTPVLGYWGTGSGEPTLVTAEGIGSGTPWVDVVNAYGDRVVTAGPDDDVCRYSWEFSIDQDKATGYFFHLRGLLDGDPDNPATAILTIYAGVAMEGC